MDETVSSKEDGMDMPNWDVALESLLVDEAALRDRPLTTEDFKRLAERYQIRFDDIMATLLELTVHGLWGYIRPDGVVEVLSRKKVDSLYDQGRLNAQDVAAFTGGWYPRDNSIDPSKEPA